MSILLRWVYGHLVLNRNAAPCYNDTDMRRRGSFSGYRSLFAGLMQSETWGYRLYGYQRELTLVQPALAIHSYSTSAHTPNFIHCPLP